MKRILLALIMMCGFALAEGSVLNFRNFFIPLPDSYETTRQSGIWAFDNSVKIEIIEDVFAGTEDNPIFHTNQWPALDLFPIDATFTLPNVESYYRENISETSYYPDFIKVQYLDLNNLNTIDDILTDAATNNIFGGHSTSGHATNHNFELLPLFKTNGVYVKPVKISFQYGSNNATAQGINFVTLDNSSIARFESLYWGDNPSAENLNKVMNIYKNIYSADPIQDDDYVDDNYVNGWITFTVSSSGNNNTNQFSNSVYVRESQKITLETRYAQFSDFTSDVDVEILVHPQGSSEYKLLKKKLYDNQTISTEPIEINGPCRVRFGLWGSENSQIYDYEWLARLEQTEQSVAQETLELLQTIAAQSITNVTTITTTNTITNTVGYTLSEVADMRVGSQMLTVSNGNAKIRMFVDESSDLTSTWSNTQHVLELDIPADADTKFYRFRMD